MSKFITPKFNFHTFFAISCIHHCPVLQVKHLDGAQNMHVYMSITNDHRSTVAPDSDLPLLSEHLNTDFDQADLI